MYELAYVKKKLEHPTEQKESRRKKLKKKYLKE